MKILLSLAALIILSPITAADTIYLTADKMLDVVAGKMIDNPALLIEGERIVEVGTRSGLAIPPDATLIDLGEMTLMPGLLDMHTHLNSKATEHGYIALKNSVSSTSSMLSVSISPDRNKVPKLDTCAGAQGVILVLLAKR